MGEGDEDRRPAMSKSSDEKLVKLGPVVKAEKKSNLGNAEEMDVGELEVPFIAESDAVREKGPSLFTSSLSADAPIFVPKDCVQPVIASQSPGQDSSNCTKNQKPKTKIPQD